MGIGGVEVVLTKRAEGTAIGQGLPVIKGTADDQAKLPTAAGDRATGISLYAAPTIGGGDRFDVVAYGPAVGIAGGPVAVDDYVKIGDTDEIQCVTIGGAPTGGDFTLTFNGQTTTALAFDATAAAVQAALIALSNIGPAEVSVSGPNGGPWAVVFLLTLAGADQPAMTANPGGLTPSGTVTITEVVKGGFKGRLVPTTTAADEVVGRALAPAAQDGDEFSLLVQTQKY